MPYKIVKLTIMKSINSLQITSSANKLMTVNEVAFQLSISKSKVYELLKSGSIQAVMIGRSRRVFPADLDRYIEKCKKSLADSDKLIGWN